MAQVTSEKFVRTVGTVKKMGLDEAGQLAELSVRLGLSESAIKSRVNQLRKKGVKIPAFTAGKRGKKFDLNGLNDIAAEFGM